MKQLELFPAASKVKSSEIQPAWTLITSGLHFKHQRHCFFPVNPPPLFYSLDIMKCHFFQLHFQHNHNPVTQWLHEGLKVRSRCETALFPGYFPLRGARERSGSPVMTASSVPAAADESRWRKTGRRALICAVTLLRGAEAADTLPGGRDIQIDADCK